LPNYFSAIPTKVKELNVQHGHSNTQRSISKDSHGYVLAKSATAGALREVVSTQKAKIE